MSVYLDMVDTVCHLFIKHMDPPTPDVTPEEALKYGGAVAAAYAHTDSLIGKWLDMVDDETTLVLISDHGFKSGDIRPMGPSAIGGGQAIKWHRIAGGIALYGNRVRRGAEIKEASVLDVAPTVLRLLGLPQADDMPGRVLEEAFDQGWLASSAKIGTIETYGTRSAVANAVRRQDEEQAILERLKALGYVGRGSVGLKRLATSHFAKGEFDKAMEIWNDVLEMEPGNVEIMTAIANALIQSGRPDQALPVLENAIEKDPGFLAAYNMLAICLINLNRLDEAADISRETISKDPSNAEAYFNLGVVFEQRGMYDQALSSFKRSVELRTDYDESRLNLANEYYRRGNFAQAKIHLEKAMEINPTNPHTCYMMGKVYQGLRDSNKAMECFRETLELAPDFNRARISTSVLLAIDGRYEEAKRELEAGLAYPQDLALVHTNLGVVNRKLGDDKAAEQHFRKAIEEDGYYLPARFDLVDLYTGMGHSGRAEAELRAILQVDPANDQARQLLDQMGR
jgi:tetratricopeptide (TPR) repeat protein